MKTTKLTGTDLLNSIYNAHKDKFQSGLYSFHNLLWQMIINETWANTNPHCFTPVYEDGEMIIGIAEENKSGYSSTGVEFVNGITYSDAITILDAINLQMFGHDSEASAKIVSSSMRQRKAKQLA